MAERKNTRTGQTTTGKSRIETAVQTVNAARKKSGQQKELSQPQIKSISTNAKLAKEALQLITVNASIFRRQMLDKLLNPGKDINYECGYPLDPVIGDYKAMYEREGVGTRVVQLMPEESWAMAPNIVETEDNTTTPFEKAWKDLTVKSNVLSYLQRADVLSGIGRFGLLLLGLNDGKNLNRPVTRAGKQKYELMYLKPLDESVVRIKSTENEVTNPRYGQPVTYEVDFESSTVDTTVRRTKVVHYSRVIHVADNRGMNDLYGMPRMKAVYNRLLDLRKIVAGSGEMFWKGGFPGFGLTTKEGMDDVEINTATVREQMDDYQAGLQRYLAIAGMEIKSLAPQVADPTGHIEAQVRYLCITLGVPFRVFMGSEEAKLASQTDIATWNKRVAKRQNDYLSPMVLRPFIDRLIELGILPPAIYQIMWPDLYTPSVKDKAIIAKDITEAMAKYVAGGVFELIPPDEYLTMVLNFTEAEAETIGTARDQWEKDTDHGAIGVTPEEEPPAEPVETPGV